MDTSSSANFWARPTFPFEGRHRHPPIVEDEHMRRQRKRQAAVTLGTMHLLQYHAYILWGFTAVVDTL